MASIHVTPNIADTLQHIGSLCKAPDDDTKTADEDRLKRCQPWNRADFEVCAQPRGPQSFCLLHEVLVLFFHQCRLATFRKWCMPDELSSAICAALGFICQDSSTLVCKLCSARFTILIDRKLSQEQCHSLALDYRKHMNMAHSSFCPWQGNECSQWLGQSDSLAAPPPAQEEFSGFSARKRAAVLVSRALPSLQSREYEKQEMLHPLPNHFSGRHLSAWIPQSTSSRGVQFLSNLDTRMQGLLYLCNQLGPLSTQFLHDVVRNIFMIMLP
jgi:hypothetical protein